MGPAWDGLEPIFMNVKVELVIYRYQIAMHTNQEFERSLIKISY
jgi:hypothetical protein